MQREILAKFYINKWTQRFLVLILISTFLMCTASTVLAKSTDKGAEKNNNGKKEENPPRIGNFALQTPSQQPGSFVSFGQNIVDKGQTIFTLDASDYIGKYKYDVTVVPGLIYGIRDDLSLYCNVSYIPRRKEEEFRSSGIGDIGAQVEYAYYSKTDSVSGKQGTLVASTFFPSASTKKDPPLGLGSTSYFLGTTYSDLRIEWLWFTSYGVLITGSHQGTKYGDNYLYQIGLGKNICSTPNELIFDLMLELTGTYSRKDKLMGEINPDSGGNVVYLTPSIWISTPTTIWQFGVGRVVSQHLFGDQNKETFLIIGSFRWNF